MAETVSDINGGGNDYSDLIDWEDDKDGDITAGNAEVAEVYADITESNVDLCKLAGWTTDADSYVAIRAGVARLSSNPLRVGQGVTLTADRALGGRAVVYAAIGCEFFRLDGLDCVVDADSGAYPVVFIYMGLSVVVGDFRISSVVCAHVGADDGDGIRGIEDDDNTAHVYTIWNCVTYNCVIGIDCSFQFGTDDIFYLYNCTAYGNSDHGFRKYADTTAINCIAYDNANADYDGTFNANSDYNMSEDATAPGANSLDSGTGGNSPDFVNVGAGTEDFHLQASSDAIDEGDDDPGSGLYSDDVDGTARSSPWDMGAVEFVAGGINIPVLEYQRLHR